MIDKNNTFEMFLVHRTTERPLVDAEPTVCEDLVVAIDAAEELSTTSNEEYVITCVHYVAAQVVRRTKPLWKAVVE